MNSVFVRVITVLISFFVIFTVGSQLYLNVKNKYETETALSYSSATKETFYGIFIRDERPIKYSGTGAVSYMVPDGSKVANNSVVASIYGSDDDIEVNTRIERLESEIALLEKAQSPGTTETAQPEFMSSLIDEKYQNIATRLAKKDISDISKERDDFLSLMSIYRIVIGEEKDYDQRLDMLYEQLNILKGRQHSPVHEVTVDSTGYFVSYTDGYEDELNTSNISELDLDRIESIIHTEKTGGKESGRNDIGKLINGYDWKMVGIIDNSDAVYTAGDTVKLRFASTSDTVTAKIELITDTNDPEKSIVLIGCEQLTFDLVRHRVEHVDMILHDYEGIRVPRNALRFNSDNDKGVYIVLGQRIMFKKINVIFECDEYLLSGITADPSYLSIYDEIVLSGVDTNKYLEGLEAQETVTTAPVEESIPVYTSAAKSEDDADLSDEDDGADEEKDEDEDEPEETSEEEPESDEASGERLE